MAGAEHGAAAAPVAVYRRTVRASLARIWENVLDWEHLPWLHRSSFLGIRLETADAEGWRAEIRLPPQASPRAALVEVRLDRPKLCYLTCTLEGVGAGTEILTLLEPIDRRTTRIAIEFRVPGVPLDKVRAVGDGYTRLYARLWDEDEGMMVRRQELRDDGTLQAISAGADRLPAIALGPIAALRPRLPTCVEVHRRRLRLVLVDGEILAHSTVCPHRGGPLDAVGLEDGHVTCPWHGYRFDLRSGHAVGQDVRLEPVGRVRVDATTGEAYLEWPDVRR